MINLDRLAGILFRLTLPFTPHYRAAKAKVLPWLPVRRKALTTLQTQLETKRGELRRSQIENAEASASFLRKLTETEEALGGISKLKCEHDTALRRQTQQYNDLLRNEQRKTEQQGLRHQAFTAVAREREAVLTGQLDALDKAVLEAQALNDILTHQLNALQGSIRALQGSAPEGMEPAPIPVRGARPRKELPPWPEEGRDYDRDYDRENGFADIHSRPRGAGLYMSEYDHWLRDSLYGGEHPTRPRRYT